MQVIIPVTIYCFRLSRPVPAPPPFNAIAGCLVLSIDWSKMNNGKAAVYVLHICISPSNQLYSSFPCYGL